MAQLAIRCILFIRRMLPSWYTASFIKHMCIDRVHDGSERSGKYYGTKSMHVVHLMVILTSNKEELHRFLTLLAKTKSQATSFVAYNWTTRPNKIPPVRHIAHHIST